MNIFIILLCLFVALVILIPLLEKYQSKMGLDGATKYAKYIWPLVMISLIIQLIYVLLKVNSFCVVFYFRHESRLRKLILAFNY